MVITGPLFVAAVTSAGGGGDVGRVMGHKVSTFSSELSSLFPSVGIIALFKDEAAWMHEWLLHHVEEGVTQIVLLDGGSSDNGPQLAKDFASARPQIDVKLFAAREPHEQEKHYGRHLHRMRTDWVLVIDLDELVYARGRHLTIPHFLASLPRHVEQVALPWKVFGSNGHVLHPRSSLIQSFTRRHDISSNRWRGGSIEYKSLFRMRAIHEMLRGGAPPGNHTHTLHTLQTELPAHLDLCAADTPVVRPPGCLGLHHSVNGLRTFFADGITRIEPHLRWSQTPRNNSKVRGLTEPLMQSWGIHLHHYRMGSCESWFRVKIARGGGGITPKPRSWAMFRDFDKWSHAVADGELARKRGADWTTRLGESRWQWPSDTKELFACYLNGTSKGHGRITPGRLCEQLRHLARKATNATLHLHS